MDEHEIDCLRKAGAISKDARELGASLVKEGGRLVDVAEEVESLIIRRGARPAFPVNIGINDVAAHYTPSTGDKAVFSAGDVVKVDVGAHVDGYVGDTAITVEVGTKNWRPLLEASEKALRMALDMVGDGVAVSSLGAAIERAIRDVGLKPVTNLTGHGMRRYSLHAGLTIPNINDGSTAKIKKDMVVAIEPFATNGAGQVYNEKPGNIFRVVKERPMRDKKAEEFFKTIASNFGSLPFCERWCTSLNPEAPVLLRTLVRHGLISSYSILREVKGGMVSQAEHTVVIDGERREITTL
ncbi:MAG: type II methionyl aminopeptidase [Methanomassiliicoccales archaeon]|jgi:methionyl aminopeptidase|nr:type II methionyl aminopeptidase [Methanomassiliicoccales archaeon]